MSDHSKHSDHADHAEEHGSYYVPSHSWWPILAAMGLFLLGLGSVQYFGATGSKPTFIVLGILVLLFVIACWFSVVIRESRAGLYDEQMNRTFQWGMLWFIVSDAMLILGLLGALWYYRLFNLPELAGDTSRILTHFLLWPDFAANWPLLVNPDPLQFAGPKSAYTFQMPNIFSTLVLLSSALPLYIANMSIKEKASGLIAIFALMTTCLLGIFFLLMKLGDIHFGVVHFGLIMSSGIYGSIMLMLLTIYLLNLFVAILYAIVIIIRTYYGHFTQKHHFAFTAFNWFWNFLLISWVLIFFSIY